MSGLYVRHVYRPAKRPPVWVIRPSSSSTPTACLAVGVGELSTHRVELST